MPRTAISYRGSRSWRLTRDWRARGRDHRREPESLQPRRGANELPALAAENIETFNGIEVDPDASPLELIITPGATGASSHRRRYLKDKSALVFEP